MKILPLKTVRIKPPIKTREQDVSEQRRDHEAEVPVNRSKASGLGRCCKINTSESCHTCQVTKDNCVVLSPVQLSTH